MSIAIVGMQGVFPDAGNVDVLWQNIRSGKISIPSFAPTVEEKPGETWVHRRPLLNNPQWFDAAFFGYSDIEAEALDPQLRMLMEQAWLVLEQAGGCEQQQRLRTGIFAGTRHSRYLEQHLQHSPRHLAALGADYLQMMNRKDSAATLLAYRLGLGGPAISVNTACSTSLLAVHLACNSLLTWECDIALAGGAAIPVFAPESQLAVPGGFLSPDGFCRPFSQQANGTIDGAGVAVVALKRLEDAERDGNAIHGVILGSAVNSDGNDKVGYAAPGVSGQTRVISDALAVSDVDVNNVGYLETHGTGTQLGDSIEISALKKAWSSHTARTGFCALGSIKANIGHAGAAAGVIGLIKTCCAVRDGIIPPLSQCETPHPALKLAQSPFRIPHEEERWPSQFPVRQAAVSSFGIGGTNVHLILQQPPENKPRTEVNPQPSLLLVSAKTASSLEAQCQQLASVLVERKDADLPGLAATLALTRSHFPYRFAVAAEEMSQAVKKLQAVTVAGVIPTLGQREKIVFMFPGQGSQHPQMTLGLYRQNAAYRHWLDRVAQSMQREGVDLMALLESDADTLQATANAQPLLFATSWALAQWWRQHGVEPALLVGHSIGEWVAACLAGVFSLDDAVRLVCLRGRLMQAAKPGRMLSVDLDANSLQPLLTPGLEIAVINQPKACVVGGDDAELALFEQQLESQGIGCRRLRTSHAFHTASMAPAAEAFAQALHATPRQPPSMPIISNLSGELLADDQACSARYWADHIRQPVQFARGLATAVDQGAELFLECGPGTVLASIAQGAGVADIPVIGSQPHASRATLSAVALLQAAGELWLKGVSLDLPALIGTHIDLQHYHLPGYAFERHDHWVKPHPIADMTVLSQLLAERGVRLTVDGEHYQSGEEINALFRQLTAPQADPVSPPSVRSNSMNTSAVPSPEIDNDIQQQITAIWQEVLAVTAITPDDNFFDLGGNSLWALQIISKVNARFGCEIHLTELLNAATIGDLTRLVEQRLFSSVDEDELNLLLSELSEEELESLLQEEQGRAG